MGDDSHIWEDWDENRNEDEDCEYQDTFGGEVMGFKGEGKGGGKGKDVFIGRCCE